MSFFDFVTDQYKHLPVAISEETCAGRVYIVTGGNTGLGLEAARHLTRCKPARVRIAVRNVAAGEESKRNIRATTGVDGTVEVWPLDLSSYDSVKAFAKRANDDLERIDAIVENAGVAAGTFKMAQGHEQTTMTNVLATFLLALLLVPKLEATAKKFNVHPHIAIVSSEVALYSSTHAALEKIMADPLNLLDSQQESDMSERYPLSKLLQVLAARQMASLLPFDKTGVVINYVNPGLCKTGLSSNSGLRVRIMVGMMNLLLGRTPEQGSRNLIYAAVAGQESHGRFVSSCVVADDRLPTWVTEVDGPRNQQLVWSDIAAELDKVMPGCVSRLLQ